MNCKRCKRCPNEIPVIAMREGDPYCSRRCCQLDLVGDDVDPTGGSERHAGIGRRVREERGINFHIRRSEERGSGRARSDT